MAEINVTVEETNNITDVTLQPVVTDISISVYAGLKGDTGEQGIQGEQGEQGVAGEDGVGVPLGGTTGQILAKNSGVDFDTEWIDPPASGVSSVNSRTGAVVLTKADVSLSNVDNTSDVNKPISSATQTALNNKVDVVVGKQLSTEDYTTSEKNKLSGVATGATANSSDATLLNRANHTGTQLSSTISDFNTAADARVAAGITGKVSSVVAGTNISVDNTTPTAPIVSCTLSYTANNVGAVGSGIFKDVIGTTFNFRKLVNAGGIGVAINGDNVELTNQHVNIADMNDTFFGTLNTGDVIRWDGGSFVNYQLTKSDVGLSNVDNTSDANKPVSTATQTALNAKQDTLVSGTNIKTINSQSLLGSGNLTIAAGATNLSTSTTTTSVTVLSDTGNDATIAAATNSAAGVLTSSNFTKLAGVQTGATKEYKILEAIDFGATFADRASITITGQTWVDSSLSSITATVLQDNPDEAYLLDMKAYVHDIVDGVGFTVTVFCQNEAKDAYGVMIIGGS